MNWSYCYIRGVVFFSNVSFSPCCTDSHCCSRFPGTFCHGIFQNAPVHARCWGPLHVDIATRLCMQKDDFSHFHVLFDVFFLFFWRIAPRASPHNDTIRCSHDAHVTIFFWMMTFSVQNDSISQRSVHPVLGTKFCVFNGNTNVSTLILHQGPAVSCQYSVCLRRGCVPQCASSVPQR